MGNIPDSQTEIPTTPFVEPVSHRRQKLIAFVAVVVAGFVMGVYLVLFAGIATPVGLTRFSVSLGRVPLGGLWRVTPWSFAPQSPERVTATGQGRMRVLDEAGDASHRYYLLTDINRFSTNIYEATTQKGKQVLIPLTSSSTFKYWLTYDKNSQTLAYVSAPVADITELGKIKDWNVSTYSFSSKLERVVAKGTLPQPQFLTGGELVIRDGQKLVAVSLAGDQKTTTLLTAAESAPFAVSEKSQTIALYNPTTHSIDYFDTHIVGQSTYLHSTKVDVVPSAMTFIGDRLLMGWSPGDHMEFAYVGLFGTVKASPVPGLKAQLPGKINTYE